ncbi:hypothetical protein [Mariprofundus ferrooxydans]|uniref:hypothetical protein n=1 Tax=Mariprofundus ferrooxydans TaxID=314344 RepID=UPI001431D9AE|nr:hypothetical protein [Mariprofundus ferrooxydans]
MRELTCSILLFMLFVSNAWAYDSVEGTAGISEYNGMSRSMSIYAYEGHGGMFYIVDSLFIDFVVGCIEVEGNTAWLAGQVRATNRTENWVQRGNWLFVRVQSGRGTIGWSWAGDDRNKACSMVKLHESSTQSGMQQVIYGDILMSD